MSEEEITSVTVESESALPALKGNGTEKVSIKFYDDGNKRLNGWYVYQKEPEGKHHFTREITEESLTHHIRSETKYLGFHETGVVPCTLHREYWIQRTEQDNPIKS